MKTIITLTLTALPLLISAGCERHRQAQSAIGATTPVVIDTLTIHDNPHEVLRTIGGKKSGLMHSPECWCLKGGER